MSRDHILSLSLGYAKGDFVCSVTYSFYIEHESEAHTCEQVHMCVHNSSVHKKEGTLNRQNFNVLCCVCQDLNEKYIMANFLKL